MALTHRQLAHAGGDLACKTRRDPLCIMHGPTARGAGTLAARGAPLRGCWPAALGGSGTLAAGSSMGNAGSSGNPAASICQQQAMAKHRSHLWVLRGRTSASSCVKCYEMQPSSSCASGGWWASLIDGAGFRRALGPAASGSARVGAAPEPLSRLAGRAAAATVHRDERGARRGQQASRPCAPQNSFGRGSRVAPAFRSRRRPPPARPSLM